MKLCTVIGARPQFIKHAALEHALSEENEIEHIVIHTGQHYDANMSEIFFKEFNLKKPDYKLSAGSHDPNKQIAFMRKEIEQILLDVTPDLLLVYGDTNSTLAGARAAEELNIKVIHVEAGLRSFNMEMPEEFNRIETDKISEILFAPSQLAMDQLASESINGQAVLIGDIMKDMVELAHQKGLLKAGKEDPHYYATIHRPYNTDDINRLLQILESLDALDERVVFSLHPRTKKMLVKDAIDLSKYSNMHFIEPVGYFDNLNYINNSTALLTDSGGMQKEAYWLKTKCITIRKETEWTETLREGWNHLLFEKLNELQDTLHQEPGSYDETLYGDGKAAQKIIDYLKSIS